MSWDFKAMPVCENPIFVVGSPRSGTSALAWALAQHSHLWTSAESDIFRHLVSTGALDRVYAEAAAQPNGWFNKHAVDRAELSRFVALGLNALFTSRSGGKRWIEQSPSHTLVLDDISVMLPDAFFVHIARDGRRVVHSMVHSGFAAPWAHDFRLACITWRRYVEAALSFAEKHPERCLTLMNEELSRDPDAGFRRLLEFIRVPYERGPIEFFATKRLNSSFPQPSSRTDEPWLSWTGEQRDVFREEAGALHAELSRKTMYALPHPAPHDNTGPPPSFDRVPKTEEEGVELVAASRSTPSGDGEVVLSTVLLSWNRADLLARTIESYLSTVSVPYELILVDNGSTDDAPRVIAAYEGRPNHHALLLAENRGGDAINAGIDRCRGRYVHVSENDMLYRPGWDQTLLAKLRTFPNLGQLSLHAPGSAPASSWSVDGLTVYVADINVGTTCICPREVYERGARWQSRGTGEVRLPADSAFSSSVKALGYVVAWNDVPVVTNLGHSVDEFVRRLPYYVANYDAKPERGGVEHLERRLREGGYRLIRDEAGQWSAKRDEEVGDDRPTFHADSETQEPPFPVHPSGGAAGLPGAAGTPGDGNESRVHQPVLREIGPSGTVAGRGFRVQADGSSAIWLACENATPDTVAVFGGRALRTTYGGPELVTALVPPELYAEPGRHEVALRNGAGQSAALEFVVQPA